MTNIVGISGSLRAGSYNSALLRAAQAAMPEVPMTRSTIFARNGGQVVRLPRAVAFPEGVHQVEIIKIGHSRLITPVGQRWDDLFLNGPRASGDFMSERVQSVADERERL